MSKWSTEDFRAVKLVCRTVMVDTSHTLVKTYRIYNTKSEP